MREDHPGLTTSVAGAIIEALSVVLHRHGTSPTTFAVDDAGATSEYRVSWRKPSDRVRATHADASRATESAAELVAILVIRVTRGLVVVQRAPRGTRNDFYVGRAGEGFESATLLEVAGRDEVGDLSGLLAQKKSQARSNPDGLPAIAAAVRFARPHVMLDDA